MRATLVRVSPAPGAMTRRGAQKPAQRVRYDKIVVHCKGATMLRGARLWTSPATLADDDDGPALALVCAVAHQARIDAQRGNPEAAAWLDELATARVRQRWRVPPPGRAAGD